ncbi:uncharacterized protein LOC132031606 [Lycium ferocissimum]|uniref:uncharacterized protein LOC132031606 n=1 Tax=Lycium ferocissimum TaxID=112874 RepID=UPI002816194A|nr:uncharacterized protein LOC132031606 [Lycium ferocissimum]
MTNGTGTESLATSGDTSMPASSEPASRTAFHPDNYTHSCHPLYVHLSNVLGSSLVTTPFDGTGYGSWRRNILVALSVRNKLGFIQGISTRPPDSSPLARQWQRCNDLVVSWLINSLTKDIARSVEYSKLAQGIWSELEERYSTADGARIFELKKELPHISQGSLDITSYFNVIKQLWDEISSISTNHCSCGGSKKADDEQKLYQFLMGLNDTYLQARSNILMIKPLPSVSNVYGILLANEKQRNISCTSQFSSGSASFHVGASGFKFTKGGNPRKTAAHVEVESSNNSFGYSDAVGSEQTYSLHGLTKD